VDLCVCLLISWRCRWRECSPSQCWYPLIELRSVIIIILKLPWYAYRVPATCTSYCRFVFQDCVLTWLLCSQALFNNSILLTSCSLSYDRSIGSSKAG
jgi:hypothetical protein